MTDRRPRLEGKVALVTGAGSRGPGVGTGKAMSVLFAREGARVLLVDQMVERAEESLAIIRGEGGVASTFAGDVTHAGDCEAMVAAAVERYGGLDILVNNVAIAAAGSVVTISEEDWDRVLSVSLKSMMLMSKYAVPALQRAGGGAIINISSVEASSVGGIRDNTPYAAAKGGVISLTTHMAVQHGRDHIRVNCIQPGYIWTPMVAHLSEEARDLRRRANPLGTEGTAWDIGWAAVFLASDEARWITGTVLRVDGGLLCVTPTAMSSYLR